MIGSVNQNRIRNLESSPSKSMIPYMILTRQFFTILLIAPIAELDALNSALYAAYVVQRIDIEVVGRSRALSGFA